jgi:shikimate kinase
LRDLLTGLPPDAGPLVLAIGGGAFVEAENASLLRRYNWASVFLDAPLEELRRRCAPQAAARPLFRDENQFRQLYERRRCAYMTADLRVDTAGKTPAQVAKEVAISLGVSA